MFLGYSARGLRTGNTVVENKSRNSRAVWSCYYNKFLFTGSVPALVLDYYKEKLKR